MNRNGIGYNNDQEGSPWTNAEIARMVKTLDSSLAKNQIQSKIITPEAGHLEYLYGKSGKAGRQIQALFDKQKPESINKLSHVLNAVVGHSYYTDNGDSSRIAIREHLRDSASFYGTNYWQTEYSMLGDGYKEGNKGKIPAMDCALFLAKVIHDDLVYADAKAWQFWNSCEPGSKNFDTRYYLLALQSDDAAFKTGLVQDTKMLWALGNYSRFIDPGMYRLDVKFSDELNKAQRAQNVMVSAFGNVQKTTLVCINYTTQPQTFNPSLSGILKKSKVSGLRYQCFKRFKIGLKGQLVSTYCFTC